MGDIVDYLEDRLATLGKRLEGLRTQHEQMLEQMNEVLELYRATEAVLEAERDARGLSDKKEGSWAAIKSKIRTMTLKDAINTIVRMKGEKGIHVDEIFEMLKDAGFPMKSKTPKRSIVGTIHHNIRKHETYEWIGPNTFRVKEDQEETNTSS